MSDPNMVSQAQGMLSALGNANLKNDVDRVAQVDPMMDLRNTLMSFFTERVHTVQISEEFRSELIASLQEDLRANRLSFDQKMVVLSRISSEGNEAADSLISVFRPSPGNPSILLQFSEQNKTSTEADVFKSLSSSDLQKLDALFRFLESSKSASSLVPAEGAEPTAEVVREPTEAEINQAVNEAAQKVE